MKKTTFALATCSAFLLGIAFAHDHEDFEAWMKDTNTSFGSLRKSVAAKNGPEAAAAAEKLSGLFEHVKSHFEEHKMADGIEFAKNAHAAAVDLAMAAKAGDWDKASADAQKIGSTCQGCHAAHREKLPDGSYKMK
jgi:cytochrome c556